MRQLCRIAATPGIAVAIILLAVWLAALPVRMSHAETPAHCTGLPEPDIRIRLEIPEPELVHTHASAEIPGGTSATMRQVQEVTGRLQGLTVLEMETGHEVSVRGARRAPGCYGLERLNVWVRVTRLRVYIASELEAGSCLYDVTLKHENRHVAVYREEVKAIRIELAKALADTPLTHPLKAPDARAALRRYSAAIGTVISDIRQKASQRMARRNAMMDTPGAYRAEQSVCF